MSEVIDHDGRRFLHRCHDLWSLAVSGHLLAISARIDPPIVDRRVA